MLIFAYQLFTYLVRMGRVVSHKINLFQHYNDFVDLKCFYKQEFTE